MSIQRQLFEKVYTEYFMNLKNRHHYNLTSRLNWDQDKGKYTNHETEERYRWFLKGLFEGVTHNG